MPVLDDKPEEAEEDNSSQKEEHMQRFGGPEHMQRNCMWVGMGGAKREAGQKGRQRPDGNK